MISQFFLKHFCNESRQHEPTITPTTNTSQHGTQEWKTTLQSVLQKNKVYDQKQTRKRKEQPESMKLCCEGHTNREKAEKEGQTVANLLSAISLFAEIAGENGAVMKLVRANPFAGGSASLRSGG